MIKITWQQDEGPIETLTIPDELVQSLEKHRVRLTEPKGGPDPKFGTSGGPMEEFRYGPKHDTIAALVASHLLETLIKPVMGVFPTKDIAALRNQAIAAQRALDDAHAAVVLRGS